MSTEYFKRSRALDVASKTIKRLGRQLARNLVKDGDEVVRHLRQRLGVLIVRDNAAMMASRKRH